MNFYLPTRLYTGRGVVAQRAAALSAFGTRCLIVTSGSAAKRCGALRDVTAALSAHGVACQVYDAVRPNPTMVSCIEGGRRAADFGAEFIIGVGGGSPLDAAKVIAAAATNPTLDGEGLYALRWTNPPLPVALVGTTAGTGSEVTAVSIITDAAGRKRSLRRDDLYAALSLADPDYTATMPKPVTASTGADALAHCLESYFSKRADEVSRAAALRGVELLLPPLRAVAEGRPPTPEQREALYHGALLGGMAINTTGTILPHKLGYYLTETHGVPHGFACAAFLPALLRHAARCAPEYGDALYRRALVSMDEMIALLRALTPDPGVVLTEGEIDALFPRWENNPGVQETVGGVSMDEIREILTELFLR